MRKLLIATLVSLILLSALTSCSLGDFYYPIATGCNSDNTLNSDGTVDSATDSNGVSLVESSVGLQFTMNSDGNSYSLSGIGSCKENSIVIDAHRGLPVTEISAYAFTHCTGFSEVKVGNGVKEIGHAAFHGCTNLENVILGDFVESVGVDAFGDCRNLKKVYISKNLAKLDERVFYYCSSLSEIEFEGTAAEWENITKGDNWDYMTGDYVVKCSDIVVQKLVPDTADESVADTE